MLQSYHSIMRGFLGFGFLLLMHGCGDTAQTNSQHSWIDAVEYVAHAQPVSLTPQHVAEAYALGSEYTDLQRDMIYKELVGNVIEWDIIVYEIKLEDGVYKVTSQPIPIKLEHSIALLRVLAFVAPQSKATYDILHNVKTNSQIRVRGKVQDVFIRTALILNPALICL